MWKIQTDYLTKPLEHGNFGAVLFDTEEEARDWWINVKPVVAHFRKLQSLVSPEGKIVEARTVAHNATY